MEELIIKSTYDEITLYNIRNITEYVASLSNKLWYRYNRGGETTLILPKQNLQSPESPKSP